jgi:hypothetical protein
MVPRFHLPSSISHLLSWVIFASCLSIFPAAFGQAVLDKTTLGQSQNDARDLQNSLIVPKRNSIKGEKTEQVDPQKLSSRSVKDAKFQGSLLDMGLGSSNDPDLHQEKSRSATDQDSKPAKEANAGSEKDSKASKQADASRDKEKPSKSADPAGHGQNKDQKATSAAAEEKSSGNATVKASATKPDGDH